MDHSKEEMIIHYRYLKKSCGGVVIVVEEREIAQQRKNDVNILKCSELNQLSFYIEKEISSDSESYEANAYEICREQIVANDERNQIWH